MSSHEEIQLELAAYAASRLEPDAGRRVEEHLGGCQDCREMLETFMPLARALREGGEALFEPHPSESTLRRYARAGKASGMEGVARHLDVCASCSLHVGAWRRQADTTAPLTRWASIALATAAGLAVGAGLSAWIGAGRAPGPSRPSLETPPGPAEASAGPLLVLPRALRGEETSVTYALDPGRTFLVVACPASIPDSAPPERLFRYEIRREGAGAVWSRIMSAADVRRHLAEGAELVTLLVPNASLTPGRYEFRLAPAESPEESSYRSALVLTEPR